MNRVNKLPEEWNKLSVSDEQFAAWTEGLIRSIDDVDGSMMPRMFIYGCPFPDFTKTELTICMLAIDLNSDEQKVCALHNIGREINRRNIVPRGVFLLAETSHSKQPSASRLFLEQDPDRIDCLSLFGTRLGEGVKREFIASRQRNETQWHSAVGKIKLPILGHFFYGFYAKALAARN